MKKFLVEITTTLPAGTAKSEVDPEKMLKRCAAASQRVRRYGAGSGAPSSCAASGCGGLRTRQTCATTSSASFRCRHASRWP